MPEPLYIVRDRLARTVDGRLVPYEHPDAAFLAYRPGDQIPLAEAHAAGLPGALKAAEAAEDKMLAPAEDKAVKIPPESRRQPAQPRGRNLGKGGK